MKRKHNFPKTQTMYEAFKHADISQAHNNTIHQVASALTKHSATTKRYAKKHKR